MNDRSHLAKDMTDAERRMHNLVFMGQVVELDDKTARVRVQTGKNTTDWLPFTTSRAGGDRSWHPPEPGEQVLVLAPGGDPNSGVVVGSVYRAEHPAPADSVNVSRTKYKDGASTEYNRENHEYTLDVPAGGKILFKIGASTLEMTADGIRLSSPRIDFNP